MPKTRPDAPQGPRLPASGLQVPCARFPEPLQVHRGLQGHANYTACLDPLPPTMLCGMRFVWQAQHDAGAINLNLKRNS